MDILFILFPYLFQGYSVMYFTFIKEQAALFLSTFSPKQHAPLLLQIAWMFLSWRNGSHLP